MHPHKQKDGYIGDCRDRLFTTFRKHTGAELGAGMTEALSSLCLNSLQSEVGD